jgi:hypothetical protein
MTRSRRRRIAIILTVVVVLAVLLGIKEYRCKLRGDAFTNLVAHLKSDAANDLKVGTSKSGLERFFSDHKVPYGFQGSQAFGVLRPPACAPLGCFKDTAFIGVQVELDESGSVKEPPKVFGMYQDCL